MSIEPKEPCGTCGGKPRLNCFDGPDGALSLVAGFCPACGRLGPMRAEVADACAAWDADNAAPCKCEWRQDDNGNWQTQCRQVHILIDGTPKENAYVFCPYCGKRIDQFIFHIMREGGKA